MIIYQLKKGYIKNNDIYIPFNTGIVEDVNGVIHLKLFINSNVDLNSLLEKVRFSWNNNLYGEGLDINDVRVEFFQMYFKKIIGSKREAEFICSDKIKVYYQQTDIKKDNQELLIHRIILEGLIMQFDKLTDQRIYKDGKEHCNLSLKSDYSTATIMIKYEHYKQRFERMDNSNDILIVFNDSIGYNKLSYEKYMSIKKDYISFLSFINGAPVRIRCEYCDDNFVTKGFCKIIYSFFKSENISYNDYIPVRKDKLMNRYNVMEPLFFESFDNYIKWNTILDLNSIIENLGDAQNNTSIEDRTFIKMITYEKITSKYAEYKNAENIQIELIDSELFDEIRVQLKSIIDNYRTNMNDNTYGIFISRLGGLNKTKRNATDYKFRLLPNDVGIVIDGELDTLLNQDRHRIIHYGNLSDDEEECWNMEILLDELIREIILRLIKATINRNSFYEWKRFPVISPLIEE